MNFAENTNESELLQEDTGQGSGSHWALLISTSASSAMYSRNLMNGNGPVPTMCKPNVTNFKFYFYYPCLLKVYFFCRAKSVCVFLDLVASLL